MSISSSKILVAVLVVAFVAELVLAQEVCHWECEVIDCDYYSDYCDYDCYDVCYPYRGGATTASSNLRGQLQRNQQYGATKGEQRTFNSRAQGENRQGKVVRMKIANPSFQTMKDGQILSTRGSPPKGFALFAGCLSSRSGSSSDSLN